MRLVRAAVVAVVAASAPAFATLHAAGCNDGDPLKLCGEIPANGCPLGRGGTCDESICAGLYDCVEGKWTLAVDCSADGGKGGDAGGDGGVHPVDGGAEADAACTPVMLSHAGEAIGCQPDLEAPDCPVAVTDSACAETVCLSGCTDFYLCIQDPMQANGKSWSAVAYCDDQGQLVVGQ